MLWCETIFKPVGKMSCRTSSQAEADCSSNMPEVSQLLALHLANNLQILCDLTSLQHSTG